MSEEKKRRTEADAQGPDKIVLQVKDLSTHYITREMGVCKAVNHVSFELKSGETLGLVGETGAGKTTVALSIMQLLQSPPAKIVEGEIIYRGEDLLKKSEKQMQKIRGNEISMVFQDPMTALNPVLTVGEQIAEVVYLHQNVSKAESVKIAAEMLETVGIPRDRFKEYPHQFSGGMKQRVVIAIALACSPKLLIADEPTTALDVTIQAQVLEMMNGLKERFNTSVILITHDLGIVAEMCQRVAVIYAGEIIEAGTTWDIFTDTRHPYTKGLFDSLPSITSGNRLRPIPGSLPNPAALPDGCKFAARCPYRTEKCQSGELPLREVSPGHFCRCIHETKGK